MKRAYWFLILFGLWCIASGYWYMFEVRGIQNDPRFFDPHVRWVAIIEILGMLLVACLIGFSIGWGLRDGPMQALWDTFSKLEEEKQHLLIDKRDAREKLQEQTTRLHEVQQNLTLKLNKARQESESLQDELTVLQEKMTNTATVKSPELLQAESEAGTLRFRINQLEFQNQELHESNGKLKVELQEMQSRKSHPEPMHPFVRPVEIEERDDLTKIKGIGPFIEKRLNMLGIYTFQQISEFTPEFIEHVTKAIEFFPQRIVRDDWVGQAARLRQ